MSLVNTFRGMAVDWRTRRPILANDVGGLSGPAIKPIALRMVWDVARALPGLPIIGIGGIANADDALEFLVAGASAVQVGTATFYDPTASERLLDDLTAHLERAGIGDVNDLIGTLRSNQGEKASPCPTPSQPVARPPLRLGNCAMSGQTTASTDTGSKESARLNGNLGESSIYIS